MFGRSYPPVNVRSAAWYLACVALLAVPVFVLLSSTVPGTPLGALEAAPEIGKLITWAAALFAIAVLLYAGFGFMYPIVLVLLVAAIGRAFMTSEPNFLMMLVPVPALLLLVTPTALGWFLGVKKKVLPVVGEREFHLPQR